MKTIFSFFFLLIVCKTQAQSDSAQVNQLLNLADSCFTARDSVHAKKYWSEALTLHPWSCIARNGLMELQGSVLCNCDERSCEYDYKVAQAEKAVHAKDYAQAELLYRRADALFPSAKLKRKIEQCHAKTNR